MDGETVFITDPHQQFVSKLLQDHQLLLDWMLLLDEVAWNEGKDRQWHPAPICWLGPGESAYTGPAIPDRIKAMMKEHDENR
jgi:hypothetical protein